MYSLAKRFDTRSWSAGAATDVCVFVPPRLIALEISNTLGMPERDKMALELTLYKKKTRGLQRQMKHSESAVASFERMVKVNQDLKSEHGEKQKESMNLRSDPYVERGKNAGPEGSIYKLKDFNDDARKGLPQEANRHGHYRGHPDAFRGCAGLTLTGHRRPECEGLDQTAHFDRRSSATPYYGRVQEQEHR